MPVPPAPGTSSRWVHNGIEYGLMQAYGEGFDILKNKSSTDLPANERFDLNMADIAEVWRRGSVVSSWLLDLGAMALAGDPQLDKFSGFVQDSGEGRWTVEAAIEEAVPAEVLTAALFTPASGRARTTISRKRCCRPCASASAAMSRSGRRLTADMRAQAPTGHISTTDKGK